MRMLQVIFTGSCATPVICGAGTASRTQTQRTISLRIGDRLLHKILEITRRGPVPIRFGGGEPLLYPGLVELLEDCQRHHIPIDMTTNDTLLDPEAAKRLKQCGLRTLTVSIDGTEPYHDGLRGGGNFAWACRGMENALQAGNHVGVAFTATACNYKNISDYTEFFSPERHPRTLHFSLHTGSVRGQGHGAGIGSSDVDGNHRSDSHRDGKIPGQQILL